MRTVSGAGISSSLDSIRFLSCVPIVVPSHAKLTGMPGSTRHRSVRRELTSVRKRLSLSAYLQLVIGVKNLHLRLVCCRLKSLYKRKFWQRRPCSWVAFSRRYFGYQMTWLRVIYLRRGPSPQTFVRCAECLVVTDLVDRAD